MSSKDCVIVSGLHCFTAGTQSNDLPPAHRKAHSFHPGPYFTSLHCQYTVSVSGHLVGKPSCASMTACICLFTQVTISCLQSVHCVSAPFSVDTLPCFHPRRRRHVCVRAGVCSAFARVFFIAARTFLENTPGRPFPSPLFMWIVKSRAQLRAVLLSRIPLWLSSKRPAPAPFSFLLC